MSKLKTAITVVRDGWLIVGLTFLLLALLEGGLAVARLLRSSVESSSRPSVDRRADADTYGGLSWTREYFREFDESSTVRWEPYVYWRRGSYDGKYIKVDGAGMRVTPGSETPGTGARHLSRIFLFGGSAMWGTGARDCCTIPAFVVDGLREKGIAAQVLNFGETGYVSTQEVIELLLQLRTGNIPDLVIFYDGVNDAFSAYQQSLAGLPMNEFHRVTEFNLARPSRERDLLAVAADETIGKLTSVRLIQGVLRRHRPWFRSAEARARTPGIAFGDATRLAQGVVRAYQENLTLVHALAASYGFQCQFYWQPTLLEKEHPTRYELEQLNGRSLDERRFLQEVDGLIHARDHGTDGDPSFHDLSGIFAAVDEPLYIDWVHLGERGNRMIARRIVDDVLPLLRRENGAGKAVRRTSN